MSLVPYVVEEPDRAANALPISLLSSLNDRIIALSEWM